MLFLSNARDIGLYETCKLFIFPASKKRLSDIYLLFVWFMCFMCVLYVYYVYMDQVPEIKLMMIMIIKISSKII